MKSLILIVALAVSVLTVHSPSNAAEIKSIENHPMGCEYMLSGLINNGDAEKIDEVLSGADRLEVNTNGWKICMDSPGGSFIEGVKLAEVFSSNAMGTVVAQNDICESACAIAFLGGTYWPPEGDSGRVSRTIHPTAKLGFHAPALIIPDGIYSKEEVDRAYEIALTAVVQLSDMRARGYDITESLFKAILTTPFESMHNVDTVGKASRYKIDVRGINIFTEGVQAAANNVCDNALRALDDSEDLADFPMQFQIVGDNLRTKGGYYAEANADCEIKVDTSEDSFLVNFQYGDEEPFATIFLSYFASFPSETLLASAFTEKTLSVGEFQRKARESTKNNSAVDSQRTCGILNSNASIDNVQNFTNLRQQAGSNERVIAQVPLGAKVSVISPGSFLRYDRCTAACNGSNQNEIKACIDNNDVWIEVEYNGQKGFLSRKFLQ
jgi:hypothetical protein